MWTNLAAVMALPHAKSPVYMRRIARAKRMLRCYVQMIVGRLRKTPFKNSRSRAMVIVEPQDRLAMSLNKGMIFNSWCNTPRRRLTVGRLCCLPHGSSWSQNGSTDMMQIKLTLQNTIHYSRGNLLFMSIYPRRYVHEMNRPYVRFAFAP
jgi:hypothetical protein